MKKPLPYYIEHSYEDDGVYLYLCLNCKGRMSIRSAALNFCPSCGIKFEGEKEPVRHKRYYAPNKPETTYNVFVRSLDPDLKDQWDLVHSHNTMRIINGCWRMWYDKFKWEKQDDLRGRAAAKFFYDWVCDWVLETDSLGSFAHDVSSYEVQLRYKDKVIWTKTIQRPPWTMF